MKNIIITVVVIIGVYFLLTAFDSSKNTTAQNFEENYEENYEDEYLELQDCLEEWKNAHTEYKNAIEDAYGNLDTYGDGDEYYDLIYAMDEAKSTLESPGDNTPYCD